jgi:dolichol-phosphate mannosyltransferase
VVIPTYNEGANVTELIGRLNASLQHLPAIEILIVDDGTDDLPATAAATPSTIDVRVIRRPEPVGGLGGAVIEGIRQSVRDLVVVMDGDLQHPPEKVPELIAAAEQSDVVVASRYRSGGDAGGLDNGFRRLVSRGTSRLSKVAFPDRLRDCSDPMSGFFAVRRHAVDTTMRPRGFKILMEILARSPRRLDITEVAFAFGDRKAGESHASIREGLRFMRQLTVLRLRNRACAFALVGLSGVIPNLLVMAMLTGWGLHYLPAGVIATQIATLWNFVGAERFVWKDKHGVWPQRFAKFLLIGEVDLIRLPFVILLVEYGQIGSVVASLITLMALFIVRFTLADRLVYKRRPQVIDLTEASVDGVPVVMGSQ